MEFIDFNRIIMDKIIKTNIIYLIQLKLKNLYVGVIKEDGLNKILQTS